MRRMAYPNTLADPAMGQARGLAPKSAKTIPFDYVFEFELSGRRGNRVQDVVQISIEGFFVATSVGYSLVPNEQRRPRSFPPVIDQATIPQNPVAVPLFSDADGSLNALLVSGMPGAEVAVLDFTADPNTSDPSAPPFVLGGGTIGPDGTVIVDLNPSLTTGIVRVRDKTNNVLGELLSAPPGTIVFGTTTAATIPATPVIGPDPATKRLPAAGDTVISIYGSPDHNAKLFLVESATAKVTRVADPIALTQSTISSRRTGRAPVQVGKALSPGDVLLVRSENANEVVIPFSTFTIPRPRLSTLTVGALTAGLERIGTDLTDGLRLNPNFANLALADLPLDQISPNDRDRIFETGCTPAEDVSFLYSIDVVGTGRELQSRPIHNIAGLGIANGDRPFRPFAKPIVFQPRSSTRIQIEELCGPPGTLYIVLQGYKLLGTAQIPE